MPAVVFGMPTNYEMIVSHSPPVYSPPNGFLSEYSRIYDPQPNSYCRPQMFSQIQNRLAAYKTVRASVQSTSPTSSPSTVLTYNNSSSATITTTITTTATTTATTTSCSQINNTGNINKSNGTSAIGNNKCNGITGNKININPKCSVDQKQYSTPKRPCLVIKSELDCDDHTDLDQSSKQRTKKKVVFADDQGHSLTEVRIMSEPSNVPPVWSLKFLAHVTQGLISPVPPEQWTITFRQPASDYLEFKKKLDTKNVSLENVIVKENESVIVGTVKVKNLHFQKEVIVRASSDDWTTQEDTFCTYSQIGLASGTYVLYDTFSFKLTLPPQNKKIEFCICYRSDGKEFWDNNDGENYTIYKRSNITDSSEILRKLDNCKIENVKTQPMSPPIYAKFPDLTQAKVPQWSEFASWSHLENSSPYCTKP